MNTHPLNQDTYQVAVLAQTLSKWTSILPTHESEKERLECTHTHTHTHTHVLIDSLDSQHLQVVQDKMVA